MPLNNKVILQTANAAILKGDYEGFLSFCTDDTEWTFVGDQTLKGKDAVRRYMAKEYIEPPRFSVSRFIEDESHIIAIGYITIKDREGNTAEHEYCDVWKVQDGKLTSLQAFVI